MIEFNWKTVRFIVVGVLGALVYFICSYLFLSYTELPAFIASLLAYACSFGFAYLGQKLWAFRSIAPHSVTLFRYAVLQACCATFAATFTQVFVSYTDVSPLLLSGLATVFTSGISYVVSSCWVFADSSDRVESMRDNKSSLSAIQADGKLFSTRNMLLILLWLSTCLLYIFMYYHMPWVLSMYGIHDDRLFINLAYSLTHGNWLGNFSQFTLMKGPGYAFFLALTHIIGLPLFLTVAIFHTIVVSFFAWCVYRLSRSRIFTSLLFSAVLFVPLVISNGRVIRDQIYPDQFLLGLSALIFSLFIADTLLKRSSSAILAGLTFAWLWLTREEGVWILPSIGVLIAFALVQCWRKRCLKQILLSSVCVCLLSFLCVHFAFQFTNQQVYGKFVGVDIKEKNFKEALAGLQSVREGGMISHVPVSQEAIQRIFEVSPSFARLRPFFDSPGAQGWRGFGCDLYPWTCSGEYAGGWFIWLLRDAVADLGYYRTPTETAEFFGRMAGEINKACDSGQVICEKSFLAHMPKITQRDIDSIPDAIEKLYKMLLISEMEPRNIGLKSSLDGVFAEKLAVLNFLHSQDRFHFEKVATITGKYAITNEDLYKIEIQILNDKGENFSYAFKQSSLIPSSPKYSPFTLITACTGECRIFISVDGDEKLNIKIPDEDQEYTALEPLLIGNLGVVFEKLEWKKALTAVFSSEEAFTYESRQVLLVFFRSIFPFLLILGLVAFFTMTLVYVKQRRLPVLFVVAGAVWLALFVRMTILLLVHISSFPAIITLYSIPLYSLLIIASFISLYLFFCFIRLFATSSP